jgi:hypothetical protein
MFIKRRNAIKTLSIDEENLFARKVANDVLVELYASSFKYA